MLKSTYTPPPGLSAPPGLAAPPPLPPGWTEHKAPTGHTYYYNAATGESTYRRPGLPLPVPPPTGLPPVPPAGAPAPAAPAAFSVPYMPPPPAINLSDPATANAFMAQFRAPPPSFSSSRGGHQQQRSSRPQPKDKPRSKVAIPGCEPWLLVYTKYGRRFVYNPVKNASYWRIPDKLKPGILELDKQRILQKAGRDASPAETKSEGKDDAKGEDEKDDAGAPPTAATREQHEAASSKEREEDEQEAEDSSEYEEVEVTDDEDGQQPEEGGAEGDGEEGHPSKRRRTEDDDDAHDERQPPRPVEFTEEDIAAQLDAMGAEYAAEGIEDWAEGEEGVPLSEEDARALFRDLLDDAGINPYSPWEKLLEDGRLYDDPRYTALATVRARREVWEEWSRDRIRALREARARQEKRDPRIGFLAFLQAHATPKLYWPEFKRKYRREPPMRDPALSDRDRERWYREHLHRLKMPQAALKADLRALLESVPRAELHNRTNPSHLPTRVLTDLRYISLDPAVRDPLVEAYISTLGPPPAADEAQEDDEAAKKAREERRRREKALQDRERAVAEEKRRAERRLLQGKAELREEERELERAMRVDKKGLQSQLAAEAAPRGGG